MDDKILHFITISLLIFSALVWGILGLTEYNIISRFARYINIPQLSRIIYLVLGIAAIIYLINYYDYKIINE
jgi:uncharacterized membrane protein YuzA (DUF378 family)